MKGHRDLFSSCGGEGRQGPGGLQPLRLITGNRSSWGNQGCVIQRRCPPAPSPRYGYLSAHGGRRGRSGTEGLAEGSRARRSRLPGTGARAHALGRRWLKGSTSLVAKRGVFWIRGAWPLPAPGVPWKEGPRWTCRGGQCSAGRRVPGTPGSRNGRMLLLGLGLGVKVVRPPSQDARSTAPGGLPGPQH